MGSLVREVIIMANKSDYINVEENEEVNVEEPKLSNSVSISE